MKIRNGFVSNSSSSSFVIIGNEIEFDEVDLSKDKIWVAGQWLCEGRNLFELKPGMLKLLKENESRIPENTTFYKVYKTIGEEGEVEKKILPDLFWVYSFTLDQHACFDEFLQKLTEVTYEGEDGVC